MNECERCGKELDDSLSMRGNSPIPVQYGKTNIVICYPCAYELTLLLGHWLGTDPMEDPVNWYASLAPADG